MSARGTKREYHARAVANSQTAIIDALRLQKPDPKSLARLDRNSSFLDDDDYLRPIIEDDALLRESADSV